MIEKLETVDALRAGSRVVYVCGSGEMLAIIPDGTRAIVAHPDRPPKWVNADGSEEPLVPGGSVEPVTAREMAIGVAIRDGDRAVPFEEVFMGKPILCVDFDGVVHSYSSGWQGADVIGDPPVPGAIAFLLAALNHFDVCIYSSRSSQRGGVRAMKAYLYREAGGCWHDSPAGPGLENVRFPEQKPAAFLTIDDRAICFDGDWSKLDPARLLEFKPWNKRPESAAPGEPFVLRRRRESVTAAEVIAYLVDNEEIAGGEQPFVLDKINEALNGICEKVQR